MRGVKVASGKSSRRRRKPKRPTDSYLSSANQLAPLVPKLKKLKKRKRLTPGEKRSITYYEKRLARVQNLYPVTKKQAKNLGKRRLFSPGVQAARLKAVRGGRNLRVSNSGIMTIDSLDGKWVFWPLKKYQVRSGNELKKAAKDAFEVHFPIEIVQELAALAFKKYHVKEIHLWSKDYGPVGQGFENLSGFSHYVSTKWHAGRYMRATVDGGTSDPGEWVDGIAILLENSEYTKRRNELTKNK